MPNKNNQDTLFDIDDFLAWKEEWEGMPEFVQEDLAPFKSIEVHFSKVEDREAFSKLLKQKLTNKTISIWYPESKRENLLSKKCIDEEDKTIR